MAYGRGTKRVERRVAAEPTRANLVTTETYGTARTTNDARSNVDTTGKRQTAERGARDFWRFEWRVCVCARADASFSRRQHGDTTGTVSRLWRERRDVSPGRRSNAKWRERVSAQTRVYGQRRRRPPQQQQRRRRIKQILLLSAVVHIIYIHTYTRAYCLQYAARFIYVYIIKNHSPRMPSKKITIRIRITYHSIENIWPHFTIVMNILWTTSARNTCTGRYVFVIYVRGTARTKWRRHWSAGWPGPIDNNAPPASPTTTRASRVRVRDTYSTYAVWFFSFARYVPERFFPNQPLCAVASNVMCPTTV